ncbi:peptidyl-prolyl cis-trans isomerase-like 3 [Eudromia elegans]
MTEREGRRLRGLMPRQRSRVPHSSMQHPLERGGKGNRVNNQPQSTEPIAARSPFPRPPPPARSLTARLPVSGAAGRSARPRGEAPLGQAAWREAAGPGPRPPGALAALFLTPTPRASCKNSGGSKTTFAAGLGCRYLAVAGSEGHQEVTLRSSSAQAVTLHTDVGDIKIELFCERTPKTCENFLALCASNYYNGCVFHRNIKGFMVQTGDPLGTGKGGNSIWGRKFEDEFSEYLKHSVRGVVSMANNGPNTNGSQFFITYAKQPHLDMKYTVFGKVIDGLETLDELEKLPVNEKTYRPLNDVHIKDITIHANPFAL